MYHGPPKSEPAWASIVIRQARDTIPPRQRCLAVCKSYGRALIAWGKPSHEQHGTDTGARDYISHVGRLLAVSWSLGTASSGQASHVTSHQED
jgi:hypothetical protein